MPTYDVRCGWVGFRLMCYRIATKKHVNVICILNSRKAEGGGAALGYFAK